MIIFMGVAGSGKSTQAGMLAQKLGCQRLGVGDLLRVNMNGRQAKKMLAGEMVEDSKLLPLLDKELKKFSHKQFILDGSPRSMNQAEWWAEKIKSGEVKLDAIIHLEVSENTAKKRLLARHRPDDYEGAINERFREYHNTIEPILSYLKGQGFPVYDINSERVPEAVEKDIEKSLGVA